MSGFVEGEILVLSGAPGAGKTTTAAAISAVPGSRKVHLHTDDFWGFIKHGYVAPWLHEAAEQNRVVLQVAAAAAERYAAGGYFVIADGVIGPWFVDIFAALTIPTHYVVLRTSLEEAVSRCHERGGSTLSDAATVAKLHGQFADLGHRERHALDTTGLTRAETLAKVDAAVSSGRFRL
jgi:chloramphenicol 3-O-phosphotransferase